MKNNFAIRTISGFLLVALFIVTIFFFPRFFHLLLFFILLNMTLEWCAMTKFYALSQIIGIILIINSGISLFQITLLIHSKWLLIFYFMIIWATDTAAMCAGTLFKKYKILGYRIVPKISPNKTLIGLVTGIVFAGIVFSYFHKFLEYHTLYFWKNNDNVFCFLFGVFIGIVAQIGDLFISFYKRRARIKDSGNIIPGHGGMLDRFDSIIFTAPLFYWYLSLS